MNICVDCKHCRITDGDYGAFLDCKVYAKRDPVTGSLIESSCSKLRESVGDDCPKWEESTSIFYKIGKFLRNE